jgi:hypothetical protein
MPGPCRDSASRRPPARHPSLHPAARPALRLMAAGVVLACLAGCGADRTPLFSTQADPQADAQLHEVQALILQLAGSKNPDDDAAYASYNDAKDKLISRGAAIENQLIENLEGNADWGVRLGCVEVLEAVGTRRCIEPLIGAVDDANPLVALTADRLLEVLCKTRMIPPAGQPAGANGLPPIASRDPNDLALDADQRLWTAWFRVHHVQLHQAWLAWWSVPEHRTQLHLD